MSNFFIGFTNLLDFLILRKYLKSFSDGRKFGSFCRYTLFFICVIGMSFVNSYRNPNLNLLCSFCLIYLYSLTFSYSSSWLYHMVLPALYIGLGFIAEPIGILLTHKLERYIIPALSYYISVIICELLRYILSWMICHYRYIQLPKLSLHMSFLFFSIPISSVFISCIAIYLFDIYNNFTEKILCLTIVILIFLTNFLTFLLFHRLSIVMNNNYKNELLLQEANAKEQYYRQIEENNKIIQKIKHDLKNRLLALYAIEKNSIVFQNEFKKLLGELDSKENKIYTINPVINMILNNKFHVAKSLEIKIDSSILVPKKINLDYSDAGILLGNLLDNAIEACTKVPVEKRWISIDIIYQRHLLIVKICNSKDKRAVNIDRSSKLDFEQHGIGIQSVKNIVEKYNRAIIFSDLNEKFEVNAILYGIKSE